MASAAVSNIVDAQTLLDLMGYRRQGPCKRALERQGVKVFDGRHGIWTTIELINAAGLGTIDQQPEKEKEPTDWIP